jgi:hypothetical protein
MMGQGSDDWWAIKRGCPSASDFDRIMTPVKKEPSTQQRGYIAELTGDVVSQSPKYFTEKGKPVNNYAMQQGAAREPDARAHYQKTYGQRVQQIGFAVHESGRFGCSPDGLVGADGGLELKCPLYQTHVLYLMDDNQLLKDYLCQVHGALLTFPDRQWWDLMSYCEGLPHVRIHVTRDEVTLKLGNMLADFLDSYEAIITKLKLTKPYESLISQRLNPQTGTSYANSNQRAQVQHSQEGQFPF